MSLHETILVSTAPPISHASLGAGSLAVYDIQTGAALASFKQTSASTRSVAALETRDGIGGVMFAAQTEKAVLNVYTFQKDQIAVKIVLPEKLSCIAVDPQSTYFAGGTSQGRIYLWEVASGIMFNAWDAHYRAVTVLRFTDCGEALISGSEDSAASLWTISSLVENSSQDELPTAFWTLSDHTLPITDIQCGTGAFPRVRLLTASVDHSVKLWDVASRTLLTTFHFPSPLAHLVFDPTERVFFAAAAPPSSNVTPAGARPIGEVYQVNLFAPRSGLPGHGGDAEIEAVGGSGDMVRIELGEGGARRRRVIEVGTPVTALALSITSSMLLAGTSTAKIHIYDVASHQLLRALFLGSAAAPATAPTFAITYLQTMLRPPDLLGHVALGVGGASAQEELVRPVAVFHRMRDKKAREKHEVGCILPGTLQLAPVDVYDYDEMLRDQEFFLSAPTSATDGAITGTLAGADASVRVAELEKEVDRLRAQLGLAKSVNDAMWETVVKKVVKGGEREANAIPAQVEEGKSRKRGRV